MKPNYLLAALAFGALSLTSCGGDDVEEVTPQVPTNDGSVAVTSCPDDHHPHLIDLGLPSGTKWACCNVGATTPEAYGNYYSWGSVKAKTDYSKIWGSDEYYHNEDPYHVTYDKLGENIAGTDYDAAHVTWKGKWVMPTQEQTEELSKNCNIIWSTRTVKGVDIKGVEVTGPNKAKIFLPANGYYNEMGCNSGGQACFWTSTLVIGNDENGAGILDRAVCLSAYLNAKVGSQPRYWGLAVRPVVK